AVQAGRGDRDRDRPDAAVRGRDLDRLDSPVRGLVPAWRPDRPGLSDQRVIANWDRCRSPKERRASVSEEDQHGETHLPVAYRSRPAPCRVTSDVRTPGSFDPVWRFAA